MPIPVWVLLGFAAWTLFILFVTVGVYRWIRILTGRATIAEWRADERQGSDWYRRAVRAHLNCLETLPVARICQSSIHLLVEQTNTVAAIRFAFFFMQVICMIAMGILITISAQSWSA